MLANEYKKLNPLEKPSFVQEKVMFVGGQWDGISRSFLYDRFEERVSNHFCILWTSKDDKCNACEFRGEK